MESNLITAKQAQQRYNISTASLRRWMNRGKLTEYRTPGGHRRYSECEIKQLLMVKDADEEDNCIEL